MMNFEISKENTITKIKASAKEMIAADIISALAAKYGEENVGMVRIGNSSKKNEIGVTVGTVQLEDGSEVPISVTIGCSVKEFVSRTSAKGKVYEVFDFNSAREAYENYRLEKAAQKKPSELDSPLEDQVEF